MADSHTGPSLDLRQLEAFVHVAEHGSFTRAAELLQTDQPALSRRVRQLEVELRHTLLVRNGRGARPTPAGELLLAHGREILQQVQRTRDAMESLQGTSRRKFSLGLVPHIARFAVLSLVRDMRAQFPRVTVTLVEGVSSMLLESLLMERIDAALMYETPGSDQIDKRTLMREDLYLVSPAGPDGTKGVLDPVRLREVARLPLIVSSRTHAIREVVEAHAARHRIRLDIALEIDAIQSQLDLVEEGYGHALLPINALVRDQRRRALAVRRVTEPTMHCTLVLATSRRHPPSAFGRNALRLIEERVVPLYVAQRGLHTYSGAPMPTRHESAE